MAKSRTRFLVSILLVVLFAACGLWSKKAKIGEQFSLEPKEKIAVAGTPLVIELKGVGHKWDFDQRTHSVFALFAVTGSSGNPASHSLNVGESKAVGDYNLTLQSAHEDRSEGGPRCDLLVTRR